MDYGGKLASHLPASTLNPKPMPKLNKDGQESHLLTGNLIPSQLALTSTALEVEDVKTLLQLHGSLDVPLGFRV